MLLVKKQYKSRDVLWLVLKMSPVSMIFDWGLTIVSSVMSTAVTAIATAHFVDTVTAIHKGTKPYSEIYPALAFILITLAVVNVIGGVIQVADSKVSVNLREKIQPEYVRILASVDYKHIENEKSWELINRMMRDPVVMLIEGINAYFHLFQMIGSIVSVFVLIVMQVWWAAIIIVVFSVPMFYLSLRAGKKNYQAERNAEKFKRRSKYLGEVLTGRDSMDERTLFGYGQGVNQVWKEQYDAGRKLQLKVTAKSFLITRGASMILSLISLLAALLLIGPVVHGKMTAGMFMGIVTAVFSMIQYLGWYMPYSLQLLARNGEYMKDLTEFVMLSEAEDALVLPEEKPIVIKSLEFRNVRFCYPTGSEYILDGLSFRLEAGRHYAFVGKNGAGKTTITKLLTGLYNEYEGEILINGRELGEYPVSVVKSMFSVVYQDFAKYQISMKDNIWLGNVYSKGTEMAAARSAGLDEAISQLKQGIDTPLGKLKEEGQELSGGQWQRVAIARSLNSNAPIKILDEPTSALDPISESNLYHDFEQLMKGKTTVFISHRLGSTKLADEILVIDAGKIVERGTHEALMAQNGQYAEMFEAQKEWYR